MHFIYEKAALGGTFDHLHAGHKKLLETAFTKSKHVTIGLTKSAMSSDKPFAQTIEPFEVREQMLNSYLKEKGFYDRATVVPLVDIYGPTIHDKDFQVIFATEETAQNVNVINTKRQENHLSPLKRELIEYIKDANRQTITSQRIRSGEIDRDGFVYESLFTKPLSLPENLRPQLQQPLGELKKDLTNIQELVTKNIYLIAVGDIIVQKLKEAGILPTISIIDFRTRRHELPKTDYPEGIHAKNDQGTIQPEAVKAYQQAFERFFKTGQEQTILIDGEEDLLALPAMLLSPLGAIVLYGQFDQGVVINNITETVKNNTRKLVEQFD